MVGQVGRGRVVDEVNSGRGAGGRLVASDGRTLPLRGVRIGAQAEGGLARVVLEQRFANPYREPLRVTYLVPLPADAAVAAYAFSIGERWITGEVDRRETARERFEKALLEGRSAGLVEQERASLFTQEIGNIPPGAEVVAELTIDQPLAWLEQGAWEWRFPMTVAPRYVGGERRVPDADRVTVDVASPDVPVRAAVSLAVRDTLSGDGAVTSPSHALSVAPGAGALDVRLAGEVALDRDVVVRWPAAAGSPGLALVTGRPPRRGRTRIPAMASSRSSRRPRTAAPLHARAT